MTVTKVGGVCQGKAEWTWFPSGLHFWLTKYTT